MIHIWRTKGYCTCSDCSFECKEFKDMVKHCRENKHNGECTSQEAIHFGKEKNARSK